MPPLEGDGGEREFKTELLASSSGVDTAGTTDHGWGQVRGRLLSLSGSREWQSRMAGALARKGILARQSDVLFLAASAWEQVTSEASIMEAINGHGELTFKKVAHDAGTHAATEHSASDGATDAERARLAELNREYVGRFGFIFLTSAFGRSPSSILDELERRLSNSRAEELAQGRFQEGLILLGRVHAEIAAISFPYRIDRGSHHRDHGASKSIATSTSTSAHRSRNDKPRHGFRIGLGLGLGLGLGTAWAAWTLK